MRLGAALAVLPLALALAVPAQAAPAKLAAHIAPMVEAGRTWTYDLSLTTWGDPDMKTKVTSLSAITCRVAAVSVRRAATLSHVTCDGDAPFKLTVPAWYAATPAGLWVVGWASWDEPTDDMIDAALAGPPAIAARPRAFRRVTRVHGLDPKHDVVVSGLRRAGAAWCAYADSSNADPDGGKREVCFAPGIGVARGLDDTGGELNRFAWTARAK